MNTSMKKNMDTKSRILLMVSSICILSCIVVIFLMLDSNTPSYYKMLVLLPLNFMILIYIYINLFSQALKSLSITITFALYFLRMVVHPITISIGNYSTYLNSITMSSNIGLAVILLTYEAFCVFLVMDINSKKNTTKKLQLGNIEKSENSNLFKFVVSAMVLIALSIIVIYPNTRYYFSIGAFSSLEKVHIYNANVNLMTKSVPNIILSISIYIFTVLKFIIPINVVKWIVLNINNENIAFALSIIIILASSLVNTPQRIYSIFIAISILIVICYTYPNKAKKTIIFILFGGAFFAFVDLFLRSRLEIGEFIRNISKTINAYFGGVQNISQSMEIPFSFSNIKYIFNDFIGSIPFTSSLIGSVETSSLIFNQSLYSGVGKADQIIPMLGNGRVYFSSVFSPLLSCILVYLAMKVEHSISNHNDIINKYIRIYFCILCCMSTSIYNMEIYYTSVFRIVIPIYILGKMNKIKVKVRMR